MEIVEKPDFQVFASEAKSGEVLSFPDVPRGWGISLDQTQGKPPLEWMNGAFKRVDLNNLYLLQQGLPAWNSAIKYPVNSIIKHLDKVYLCVKENTNSSPVGNSSDWVLYVKNATTTQKGIVQLSSVLGEETDKAATPKVVNDVNIVATNAQKSANAANDKANQANALAEKANEKIKPISEGGTGAKTAVDARRNLGIGNTVSTTGDSSADAISQKTFTDLSFGVEQEWQDVTNDRSMLVDYINNSKKAIVITVTLETKSNVASRFVITSNGIVAGSVTRAGDAGSASKTLSASATIPGGAIYKVEPKTTGMSILEWTEIR